MKTDVVFNYIRQINNFVKDNKLKVSFKEFYIDDIINKNRRINPLLRFLKPIFFKKKDKLEEIANTKSAFMKTMKGLHYNVKKQYDRKTRIFVSLDKHNPILKEDTRVVHTLKGKLTNTYFITKKSPFETNFYLNTEPTIKVDMDNPGYSNVHYQVKKPKDKVFGKLRLRQNIEPLKTQPSGTAREVLKDKINQSEKKRIERLRLKTNATSMFEEEISRKFANKYEF